MANYGIMSLTQQGMNLFSKAQSGTALNFTRMQIGSGQLSAGQDPSTRTSLITPIAYVPINTITESGNTAYVKGIFDNSSITSSTYSCELGLFAQDPDLGEILYSYANAGAQGDTIPPLSSGPFSRLYQINAAVGNATSVTATIPSNTYVPYVEKGVAGGVATLDNNTFIPDTQIPSTVARVGTTNQDVEKFKGVIQRIDTRSTTETYDGNGNLTQIVEKDGSTTVKATTFTYTSGNLTQVQEVVGGNTITTTLSYDGSNNLTGTTRTVS